MTRRRWLLLGAAALTVVLVLVIGALALRPLFPSTEPTANPERSASPAPTTPPPPPWESTQLPGYVPDPGPLELTPLSHATGDPVSVSLELEKDALETGGTIGLSFDARELANPIWNSETSNLTLTLRELDRPVLRFGGNGVDRHMWWTSSSEPAPDWAEVTVTPADLERVAAVAEDVDAQVTLVLDLGHNDASRAADMAAHAEDAFGDRLIAVAIGNEPNGYYHPNQPKLAVRGEDWGPGSYQDSVHEYSAAIEEAAPGLPIAGPGAYDAPWWRAFAEADIPNQRALTMHWYPLWDCDGPDSSIANPTVEDLTSPKIRERAHHIVGMGAEIAAEHDLPLWMEETGPTSCPGTNDTSRTHAQALWTVDYVMTLMELGVERTAFHATLRACQGGAPMSPLCATGPLDDPGEIVAGRTSYLALMMLGWMPDGKVLSPRVSGDGSVMVHGVLAEDGTLALALVDMRDPAAAETAPVTISTPTGLPGSAPEVWELSGGAALTGEALESHESLLTAPADISGELAGAPLQADRPLKVSSDPGSVTLLTLEPAQQSDPFDAGR